MAADIKALQMQRRLEKSTITRTLTFVQSPPQEITVKLVQSKLYRLETAWISLTDLTKKLYEFHGEEGFVDPEQDFVEYEDKFINARSLLEELLPAQEEFNLNNQNVVFARLAEQQSSLSEQHASLLQRLDTPAIDQRARDNDLPKIRIEPFTGDYKAWPAFKDIFVSAVDSRTNLSNIQKFHYLKSLLQDEAANLIRHMQITDLSYETAWERLKERFDRPRHIVNSYIENFMTLPSVKEANSVGLRRISDISNEVIRGLEAIDFNERDHWLIYILRGKIDSDTEMEWAKESRNIDKPSISTFLRFLDQRCEELELGKKMHTGSAGPRHKTSTSLLATNDHQRCGDCGSGDHNIHKCPRFLSLSVDKRRSRVKENSLCFNCLRKGHTAYACTSLQKCRTCQRSHHTLVHWPASPSEGTSTSNVATSEPDDNVPVSLNSVVSKPGTVKFVGNLDHILPTALVDVRNREGEFVTCRVLLDTASELSYVTDGCLKRLGLSRTNSRIALSGISSIKAEATRGHTILHIRSRNSQLSIDAQVHILGRITSSLPRSTITNYDPNKFDKVLLADPKFYIPSSIDILLGAEYVWDVVTEGRLFDDQGKTIAISTIFGWVVTAVILLRRQHASTLLTLVDIDRSLRAFWEIEECNVVKEDEDSRIVEQHFQATHARHSDGKYIVELPFKKQDVTFADTLNGALVRFYATERRNPTLKENYTKFMQDYHSLGHMRELSPEEISQSDDRVFYLPHHPVVGTKIRVVFDGSFQDSAGNSLSDNLHIGPSIQRNLVAVCLRFRLHEFVFSADIVKMFRQIWVAEDHRNFQRVLWRDNPDEPLKHYQLCTVTYGTASAPFLSVRVLEQIARDYRETYPNASKIVLEDFYVDDVLTGASSESELFAKRDELVELLSQAGLELSKWVSNSDVLATEDQDKPGFLGQDGDNSTKVLGIHWYSTEDVIGFKISLDNSEHATKRRVLSDVARIFDPLGLVSPVVIKLKILFQELWLLSLGWDDPLPQNLATMWIRFRNDLHNLDGLKLPRFVPNDHNKIELHGFCDASMKAYSAVVYVRMEDDDGSVHVSLIASKTRVSPLKQTTLPRLELCGALLLTRLIKSIISALPHGDIEICAWCDSTVVLSWLSMQPIKLKTFVGNRTAEILETLPRCVWRHVNSKENPADCASRGLMADQLLNFDIWWAGPSFLRQKGYKQTKQFIIPTGDNDDIQSEMKTDKTTMANICLTTTRLPSGKMSETNRQQHPLEPILDKVSTWWKFVRITAYVRRFINRRVRKIGNPSPYLTSDEIKLARTTCLRMAQTHFAAEIRSLQREGQLNGNSKLLRLSPYLDDHGLLRVGGRICNSELPSEIQHPIILPKKHRITQLILEEEHWKNLHPGVSALFVIVRQHYWIVGARNLIRELTHKCLKCFRQAQHTTQQRMADLPAVRVRRAYPFQNTGCDYAGPFVLKMHKGRNAKTSKGYICLFVCMVTSAIHLELATDLSTDCFLAALRRFMARRGKCSNIFSDNGSNFVGAKRKLNEMYQHLQADDHNEIVTQALAKEGINWSFIPPYSPHWGGLWESGVRSVKMHLRRVIGTTTLTFEQMHTLLAQVEAVVNSRPLGFAPDTDNHYLSPSHFLLGRPTTMVPEGDLTGISTNRLDYWQNIQCMYQGFWKKWSREYLTSLQNRPKWCNTAPNIEVQNLVLVKEDNTPPATWITGRVVEIFPGADGLVRVVRLQTARGTMTRPITRIAKLPIC